MKNNIHGYWPAAWLGKFSASRIRYTHAGSNRTATKDACKLLPGSPGRRCFLALIGALLCAASHGATNPHWKFAVPDVFDDGSKWFCQTEVRDHDWYMRCDDLTAILGDDPVLKNNVDVPASRLIPLYGAPFPDSPLPFLAESVLCGGERTCAVVVAAW